ncbi:MAG: hypothetical protein RLZZ245_896 [Verrucomicrobiota bacterium]
MTRAELGEKGINNSLVKEILHADTSMDQRNLRYFGGQRSLEQWGD